MNILKILSNIVTPIDNSSKSIENKNEVSEPEFFLMHPSINAQQHLQPLFDKNNVVLRTKTYPIWVELAMIGNVSQGYWIHIEYLVPEHR